jgi:uncharacterized delta-60 repeat protein
MKSLYLSSIFLVSVFTAGLLAQPGTLDPSFGGDGKVTTDLGGGDDGAFSVAIQPDGKIVVAGDSYNGQDRDFALARYNIDGSFDNSFSGDGIVTTDFGGISESAISVAIQPDGKIVVGGYSYSGSVNHFALARYNIDGSPDIGFSGDGQLITDLSGYSDIVQSITLQPDGKIVAAGLSSNGTNPYFALARYNSDGSLDNSFSDDGKVTTDFDGEQERAYSVVLMPDGKIVVAGNLYDDTGYDFALARYNIDGSPDNGFGSNGEVTTDFGGGNEVAYSVALQPDGKIVAAGYSSNITGEDFALARYNIDGSLDNSFSDDGFATNSFGSLNSIATSVAIQPDGKIVVAGYSFYDFGGDFALSRYNIDGSLDNDFGAGGQLSTNFGFSDFAYSVALQPDGKIVVAGISQSGTDYDFGLARYFSDLGVDTYNPSDAVDEVSIYPNPGSDYINVDGECMDEAQIINTLGQTLPVQIKNGQIDIHDLPNGTYLLKTETKDHGYAISKFLKMN